MASGVEHGSFLYGANLTFIAELYQRYLEGDGSVDASWRSYFNELGAEGRQVLKDIDGPSWGRDRSKVIGQTTNGQALPAHPSAAAEGLSKEQLRAAAIDSIRALMLIRSYRVRGHLAAKLDPLGLEERGSHPELEPANYGFTEADMDREIFIDMVLGLQSATLHQIMDVLRQTYGGHIGIEFMHIQDPDQKAWLQRQFENTEYRSQFSAEDKIDILEQLTRAEGFERFLHVKYAGTKRFGLDGGESTMVGLETILRQAAGLGVHELVLGMPHRGRLNVLANYLGKPYRAIFSEFQGLSAHPEEVQGSGDVKYHLGTSTDREVGGENIHLSLTANPSHLEAVDPVVLGKVRAKQDQLGDLQRRQVMPLLMHGDAAFAGQGLVAEILDMAGVRGYRCGGTIHFIINNQIGFTTAPGEARTGPYCTEWAKLGQAPIFHVNGDDPEAVAHICRIATEFRQKFQHDVVIDMYCYRRFGHNEGDEPAFTQPLMYERINSHRSVRETYAKQLVDEGVLTQAQADEIDSGFRSQLEQEFDAAGGYKPNKADWLEGKWKGLATEQESLEEHEDTAAPMDLLMEVGRAITEPPEGLDVHRKIIRQMEVKRKNLEDGKDLDWAMGELLAYGTLVCQGKPVRLSGQDCGRGTFSHRHAELTDQKTGERFVPLNHIRAGQARFEVWNSPLSEAGILGFEYGYSSAEPHALVLWEAQFGDFANGAQVIIDQFIASAEAKWLRLSGLVMLLPHGYEGQGPEHSSARPERYLQLCAENNMRVCNVTTPANYFHALRRQVMSNIRKPLIVFTPKSLLRHKLCVSTLEEMGPGTSFRRVFDEIDKLKAPSSIKRVVLCTGKIYYDLLQARRDRGIDDVALVRVEQLYPFPRRTLGKVLKRYPKAEVLWCQEEPENMGAWTYMDRRLERALVEEAGRKNARPRYVGRPEAASPATGSAKRHAAEQEKIIDTALTLD
ncbi:MAG: 2-oxoglutarate dehydrogenase E1 component [Acetobacterales bacterium]